MNSKPVSAVVNRSPFYNAAPRLQFQNLKANGGTALFLTEEHVEKLVLILREAQANSPSKGVAVFLNQNARGEGPQAWTSSALTIEPVRAK